MGTSESLRELGKKKNPIQLYQTVLRVGLKKFFYLKISEVILNIQLGLRFTYFFSYVSSETS